MKLGINGFGRIGRMLTRANFSRKCPHDIVMINTPGAVEASAHLYKYDSVHGPSQSDISVEKNHLVIDGHEILMTHAKDPQKTPWGEVDWVLEASGRFKTRQGCLGHIQQGAKRVLQATAMPEADRTIVMGVNDHQADSRDTIISAATCTTNALAPIIKPIYERFGIAAGQILTVHAYTNDQNLVDGSHSDWRRMRSAASSIIPTKTGAASTIASIFPELEGKLAGYALRVPVANVSFLDITLQCKAKVDLLQAIDCLREASSKEMRGILACEDKPLVSIDFIGRSESAIIDVTACSYQEGLLRLTAWYDNEMAFAHRMLELVECEVFQHAATL